MLKLLIKVKNISKCTILEGGGKYPRSAKQQLIRGIKTATLSPQIFIAFLVIILAVSGSFNALFACNNGFHCVGAFNCTHSVQYQQCCGASAICSLVGVFAEAKSTSFAFLLPQRTNAAKSALKLKSAMAPAGFGSLALPQPLPPFHTALHSLTFCQNHPAKSLHFTLCDFDSKMQYCKNLCQSAGKFLHAFVKSANICVLT